ncbi:Basement membrane-specific heparan sulfate proteoglycan core protein-like protein, partial [Dinothrombium tinctorium]
TMDKVALFEVRENSNDGVNCQDSIEIIKGKQDAAAMKKRFNCTCKNGDDFCLPSELSCTDDPTNMSPRNGGSDVSCECKSGQCAFSFDGTVSCICPLGKAGKRCEIDAPIYDPALTENSFLSLSNWRSSLTYKFEVNIKMKIEKQNDGIIMYCGDSRQKSFMALILRNKLIEFIFDTGSHASPVTIKSEEIEFNKWYDVKIEREHNWGKLTVGNQPSIQGSNVGAGFISVNYFFIGRVQQPNVTVSEAIDLNKSFIGCIAELSINDVNVDLVKSVSSYNNIASCNSSSPCEKSPCQRNATCVALDEFNYSCECHRNFTGKNCEKDQGPCFHLQPCQNNGTCIENIFGSYRCCCALGYFGRNCDNYAPLRNSSSVSFGSGSFFSIRESYITLNQNFLHTDKSSESEEIQFNVKTSSQSGILFFHGQKASANDTIKDFISIEITRGYVELQFEIGNGWTRIKSDVSISDGKVHLVKARRNGNQGELIVDNSNRQIGRSVGTRTTLDAEGDIYIGGIPNYSIFGSRSYAIFTGCISNLIVQNTKINFHENAIGS